jgi:glycosyltransferase involved in cell wall biosynthesis
LRYLSASFKEESSSLAKRKICIFTGYFPLQQGGAEYQAYLLAKSLPKAQFDAFFIMFSRGQKGLIQKDGYKIYSIKINKYLEKFGKTFIFDYFKIRKILLSEKPDIVYRRMGTAIPGILYILKRKLKYDLIWACSSDADLKKYNISERYKILNYIDEIFKIYGIENADKIIVQTDSQRKLLLKNFNQKAFVVPNSQPTEDVTVKKKTSPIQIVWVANFKKLKQPDIFLNLAEKFEHFPDVRFIMIGKPYISKNQIKLERRMISLNQLEYKGEIQIEEVNKILSESHIFVNTSLYEGLPNTFIQAWMRKMPVVTLHTDPDNMIKENNIGFHSVNFDQLVGDIRLLVGNNELREEMGERAHNFAIENFSLANLDKLITIMTRQLT